MQGAAGLFLPVMLVQFGLVMGISAGIRRMSATLALLLFFVYSATMGVTTGATAPRMPQTTAQPALSPFR